MIIRLSTETQEGNVYPFVEVKDVAFTLNAKTFQIKSEGDLPLYKTKKFEDGLKVWMQKELTEKEKLFRTELQRSEREIMQTFAFKKELKFITKESF